MRAFNSAGTNVALSSNGGTAAQSSLYQNSSNYATTKTINDNTGDYCHTNSGKEIHWLEITLQTEQEITSIGVVQRTGHIDTTVPERHPTKLILYNQSDEVVHTTNYQLPWTQQNVTTPIIGTYIKGGNIGIGTDDPRAKLEISGSLDGNTQLWESSQIIFSRVDSNYSAIMGEIGGYHRAGVNNSASGWPTGLYFKTYAGGDEPTTRDVLSTRMVINAAGNVGIGTDDPKANLDISHDLHIAANNTDWNDNQGKGIYMRFSTNNTHDVQDAAFIQSIDRTTNPDTAYPMNFYGSQFTFSSATVSNIIDIQSNNIYLNKDTGISGNLTLGAANVINFDDSTTNQHIRLYGGDNGAYGLGVQSSTLYLRTHADICFFEDGTHVGGTASDPGTGGKVNMKIKSGGNVGIGETNPSYLLDLKKSNTDNYIRVQGGNTGATYSGIFLSEFNNTYGWMIRNNCTTDRLHISHSNTSGTITDKIAVNTNGFVGIGTDSPRAPLDVHLTHNSWTGYSSFSGGYLSDTGGHGALSQWTLEFSMYAVNRIVSNVGFVAGQIEELKKI